MYFLFLLVFSAKYQIRQQDNKNNINFFLLLIHILNDNFNSKKIFFYVLLFTENLSNQKYITICMVPLGRKKLTK